MTPLKPIILSDTLKNSLRAKFEDYLTDLQNNPKPNTLFRQDYLTMINLETPTIFITPTAALKMQTLVNKCTTEIGWHGLVKRDGMRFLIYDIIVYPQYVTGATISSDETEYCEWMQSFEDDVFNSIRFQGHSHVNMGTTPSGTDNTLYNSMLDSLRPDDFYIFMILNKKSDMYIMLYDLLNNFSFTGKDIDIVYLVDDEQDIDDWYATASESIKKPKTVYSYTAVGPAAVTPVTKPAYTRTNEEIINDYYNRNPYDDEFDTRNYLDPNGALATAVRAVEPKTPTSAEVEASCRKYAQQRKAHQARLKAEAKAERKAQYELKQTS